MSGCGLAPAAMGGGGTALGGRKWGQGGGGRPEGLNPGRVGVEAQVRAKRRVDGARRSALSGRSEAGGEGTVWSEGSWVRMRSRQDAGLRKRLGRGQRLQGVAWGQGAPQGGGAGGSAPPAAQVLWAWEPRLLPPFLVTCGSARAAESWELKRRHLPGTAPAQPDPAARAPPCVRAARTRGRGFPTAGLQIPPRPPGLGRAPQEPAGP